MQNTGTCYPGLGWICQVHIGLSPGSWQTSLVLGRMCRYSSQILIFIFIGNETHECAVTKCTAGEAWCAFSWHHSMNTQPMVPAFISHAYLKCTECIHWYEEICISFFSKLGIINSPVLSSGLIKFDETICYCWCPIVMKWSLYGCKKWSLWLRCCEGIEHWDKQSWVTMAIDL